MKQKAQKIVVEDLFFGPFLRRNKTSEDSTFRSKGWHFSQYSDANRLDDNQLTEEIIDWLIANYIFSQN